MSIGVSELFGLEMDVRTEAERLRLRWPEAMLLDPMVPAETKIYASGRRQLANRLDRVGDLLCGMQADWPTVGPLLRRGYLALQLPVRPVGDDAA